MPPNLSAVLTRLGAPADTEVYGEAERRFGAVHSVVERSRARRQATLDAEDSEPEEVRAWLSGVGVPPDAEVIVLWPFDRVGTRMAYQSFVDNYDDLWYPSSDDVVVYRETGDELNVIVLDHEEELAFASLSRSAPNEGTV